MGMIFNVSMSEQEEEDDDNFRIALVIILNKDFRWPEAGSQLSRLYINQNRAEDHAKITRHYFNICQDTEIPRSTSSIENQEINT
jgi:hypothetical protein